MTFQHKPGMGALFPNKEKKGENHPDVKGELCLNDGQTIRFAGWRKEGAKGVFYSLKQDRPREDGDAFRAPATPSVADRDDNGAPFDDEIPW